MYSNSLRPSFLKINEIKFTYMQFGRFFKFKLIVFHIVVGLWHLWLNYHTFLAVWSLMKNRWDLVEKTCGFGSQYITVWNQVILQTYFSICLLQDILDIISNHRYVSMKSKLKKVVSYYFVSFVFPVSFVVCINFWTYYSIKREIIDEDNVMNLYIPNWINHGLHTIIVLLVCTEKIFVHHSYPDKKWGFIGVCSIIIFYSFICTLLYTFGGSWPYPLIRGMNTIGRILFVLLNCLMGIFFVLIGEAINKIIWGRKITRTFGWSSKKMEKKVL